MEVHPLDPAADVAVSEQLRSQLASRVASGELVAGTRLPTVRALADELGLAANTVAKTYRRLETDGVVTTEGRRGTFVASARTLDAAASRHAVDAAGSYAATARRLGLTLPEAQRLLEDGW